jgi:hypothetical protein
MRSFAVTVSMLAGVLLAVAGCSGPTPEPVLPSTPFRVADDRRAETKITDVFHCNLRKTVPAMLLRGDNLEEFKKKHAQGMTLFAITDENHNGYPNYVWVSSDGHQAVSVEIRDENAQMGGRVILGCTWAD